MCKTDYRGGGEGGNNYPKSDYVICEQPHSSECIYLGISGFSVHEDIIMALWRSDRLSAAPVAHVIVSKCMIGNFTSIMHT